MKEEEIIGAAINNIYQSFSSESDKQDKDAEMLTREYIQNVLNAYLRDPTHAYRAGEKLSADEWASSAVATESRTEIDRDLSEARSDYYDARARAIRGKNGRSGYGEYAASEHKANYERAVRDASSALAESYGEFYEERESGRSGATFDQRLKAISYIASNRMTEREGLLYALAAGLSYEEAAELARGASILGSLLDERFENYRSGLEDDTQN